MNKFVCTICFAITSILTLQFTNSKAQNFINNQKNKPLNESKEIKINEEVPKEVIEYLQSNLKKKDVKALNGKCLLIDFWAVRCSPCIKSFPTMNKLQKKYSKSVQMFIVNSKRSKESNEKVTNLLAAISYEQNEPFIIPSITQDTILIEYFPHKAIPHTIWIDENRIIKAITYSDQITDENLNNFILNRNTSKIKSKIVFSNFDHSQPLLSNYNVPNPYDLIKYRVTFTGHLNGLYSRSEINFKSKDTIYRIYNTNQSALDLYRRCIPGIGIWPNNRFIMSSETRSKLIDTSFTDMSKIYSFELITAPIKLDSGLTLMKKEVDRFLSLSSRKDRLEVMCLYIEKNTQTDSSKKQTLKNNNTIPKIYKIEDLISITNTYSRLPLIVNPQNIDDEVPIYGLPNWQDTNSIIELLNKEGFNTTPKKHVLDVIVLTKQ